MHSKDEGVAPHMLDHWFVSTNHHFEYYLGPQKSRDITVKMKAIKYPRAIKNGAKSMDSYKFWSAHEFRTLFDHILIYILKDEWPRHKEIYYNLVKFILYSRLLSQDYVSDSDNENAQRLINSFVEEFEKIYGTKAMTHNLHTQLHMPMQVRKHAPFHKCNCYPFEAIFKICRQCIFGSRYTALQIATGITTRMTIRKYLPLTLLNNIQDHRLKGIAYK